MYARSVKSIKKEFECLKLYPNHLLMHIVNYNFLPLRRAFKLTKNSTIKKKLKIHFNLMYFM